ncbi:glycerol-3-phosphate dehydrogenase/oxidase [Corynebacterium tapiri]
MSHTGHSPVLSPDHARKAWEELGTQHFDLLIIGGGSVGAGTALDAATRGLKVAVVEARDIAGGTSSRSSKMFHGGLRYLAMLDFALVAESLRERELSMSHLAPHLVKPLRFIFPLTHRIWERPYMASGFALYDLMGGAKSVPFQKHLSHKKMMQLAPGLKEDALVGGVRYYDTLVDDARHTLTVLRTAAQYGALIRTSTQVTGFVKDGERVTGLELKDTDTGEVTTAHANCVINATGVWNDEMEKLAGTEGMFNVHASKGVHIVVKRDVIDADAAMTFVTEKSVLFVIPWKEHWIIGTTDTDWTGNRANPAPTAEDVDYILDHVNAKVRRTITRDDIVGVYSGLRPLLEGKSESTSNLSRNHAVAKVLPGMVSVAGGKYTTYRVIGKDAVDRAADEIAGEVPESVTDQVPLLGADGYHALANQVPALARRLQLSEAQTTHLLDRYGSLIFEVLEPAADRPELLEPVPGAEDYLKAEVHYAVTHEGARHIDDVLSRRLRVNMEYAHRGAESAEYVADVLAEHLEWSDEDKQRERSAFDGFLKATLAAEREATDEQANQVLAGITPVHRFVDTRQDN